jgi:hypothetical protein
MSIRGKVKNGVIVLEGKAKLPEGTVVCIEPLTSANGADDAIYRLGERAVPTGIPDLSLNLDHYLYGHPKVDDGKK